MRPSLIIDRPYRGELDGVRAIAVLAVILFHVGFPDMPGGFVGVDVFFVLSGYLICGQTYLRLQTGSYSVSDFFARRIRRLSSAYSLCFVVTALAANAFFLRSEMQVVVDGYIGSITFTNNFNLMASTGYFAGPAHENPFLHTWSLSIEEQFYIVLPLLILAMGRSASGFARLLVVALLASLALTLFFGDLLYDRDQRYFSSLMRVWQIAAGGLTFLALHRGLLPRRVPFAPLVGVAMILATVHLLDARPVYPGWMAIWPVLGTVLLLAFADPRVSPVARILASRPLAYIGRISYGAYLWHWPVIVGVIYYGINLTDEIRAVLLLVALALGAMSYHLVETPARRISVRHGKRRLYLLFAAQSAVLIAVAFYLVGQPGKAAQGEDARLEAVKAEIMNVHDGWDRCWSRTDPAEFCRLGVPGAGPDFMVWGDSMANSAFWAFDDYGRARGQGGRLATAPGCAPLARTGPSERCLEINRKILTWLTEEAPPMDVFLIARWSFYSEGFGHYGDRPGQVPLLVEGQGQAPENFPAFLAGLEGTLAALSERHRVIVVNAFPEYPSSVPKAMLRSLRFGTEPRVVTRAEFHARNGRTMAALREAAERFGAVHVAPEDAFCTGEICDYQRDGRPLFIDNVHLGPAGNMLLRDMLLAAVPPRPQTPAQ